MTAWAEQRLFGAEGREFDLPFMSRCLVAGRAICFHLGKLLWPANLTFMYPRWQINPAVWWQHLYPAAALLLLAGLWALRNRSRAPLAALLLFAGTLFPALGFFNAYSFRYSFVNDHHQYLASLGIIALDPAAGTVVARGLAERRLAVGFLGLALLGTLATLTWRQSRMYTDMETLWVTTIARNPNCFMAHNNLGNFLAQQGKYQEAVPHFQEALRLKPDYAGAHRNLALSYRKMGMIGEAIAHYHEVIRLDPDSTLALKNLAWLLATRPEPQFRNGAEAVPLATRACELTNYQSPPPLAALAAACAEAGHFPEAVAYAEQAQQLVVDPRWAGLAAPLAAMLEAFRANRPYHVN